ncbi:MAG: DUF3820 family protein [Spirochaetes bacterium]|nr:DUF3820 family protein [Spirochaetota bacterium]
MNKDNFNNNVDFSSVFSAADYAYFYKLSSAKMPFGKYCGKYIKDLPENYLIWLKRNCIPSGELKIMIDMIYEIKLNGMEDLLRNL